MNVKFLRWFFAATLCSAMAGAYGNVCFHDFMLKQFPDPLKVVLDETDVIFIGEVEAVTQKTFESKESDKPTVLEQSVAFNVSETILGKKIDKTVIDYKAEDSCNCVFNFDVGGEYLVFASARGDTGSLSTFFCSYIKVSETPEARELINAIEQKIK